MIIRKETPADYEAVYELVKAAFAAAEHSDGGSTSWWPPCGRAAPSCPGCRSSRRRTEFSPGTFSSRKSGSAGGPRWRSPRCPCSPRTSGGASGSALIAEGHRAARELRYPFSVVLGSERYYPKFGYLPAERFGIRPARSTRPSENFMALPLSDEPVRMEGVVRYAKEFGL